MSFKLSSKMSSIIKPNIKYRLFYFIIIIFILIFSFYFLNHKNKENKENYYSSSDWNKLNTDMKTLFKDASDNLTYMTMSDSNINTINSIFTS